MGTQASVPHPHARLTLQRAPRPGRLLGRPPCRQRPRGLALRGRPRSGGGRGTPMSRAGSLSPWSSSTGPWGSSCLSTMTLTAAASGKATRLYEDVTPGPWRKAADHSPVIPPPPAPDKVLGLQAGLSLVFLPGTPPPQHTHHSGLDGCRCHPGLHSVIPAGGLSARPSVPQATSRPNSSGKTNAHRGFIAPIRAGHPLRLCFPTVVSFSTHVPGSEGLYTPPPPWIDEIPLWAVIISHSGRFQDFCSYTSGGSDILACTCSFSSF